MTSVKERIQQMDDFQLLRFFEHFSKEIFGGLQNDLGEIQAGIPPDVQAIPEMDQLAEMDAARALQQLPKEQAVYYARSILVYWAADDQLSQILAAVLDNYKDDEMAAGVILAIGTALSMILVSSTANFKVKIGGFELSVDRKRSSQPQPETVRKLFWDSGDMELTAMKSKLPAEEIAMLQELITEDDFTGIIEKLQLPAASDHQLKNNLLNLSARYHQLQKRQLKGILSTTDIELELNRIRHNFILLIEQLS